MPPEAGNLSTRKAKGAKTVAAVSGALLTAGLGFFLLSTSLGDGLVSASYDLPFQFRPVIHPKEAVMVYLDDASYEKLQQKYTQPWNRAYFTRLLNRLTADQAKAVVFDIVFSDALDPATDQAFAKAMENNGKVVLATDLLISYLGSRGAAASRVGLPARIFDDSCADLGLSAVFPDAGEQVRKYVPTSKFGGGTTSTSSEAWAAATLANPSLVTNKTLQDSPFWLNYYGPELITLPSVSLYQALADSDPNVPPGYFSNKVVFVGARLSTHLGWERKDEYATPFSYLPNDKWMSGVAIHATAFLNLVRGDYLRRLDWLTERVIILAFGVLFGAGLVLVRPFKAVLLALVSVLLIALADYYCFAHWFYWFPFLIPVAVQIPVALIWSVASDSVQLHLQLRALQNPPS